MTPVFAIFTIAVIAMLWLSVRLSGTLINVFSALAIPYCIIVPFNRLFAAPLAKFYTVEDNVILMLGTALTCFFVGCVGYLAPLKTRLESEPSSLSSRLSQYNISAMTKFVIIINIICLARVALDVLSGNFNAQNFDSSTEAYAGGVTAHLSLIAMALTPLLLLQAITHKDRLALLAAALTFAYCFCTFIKYLVLGLLVGTILFILINDPKRAKAAIPVAIFSIVAIFVANYLIGFAVRDMNVDNSFYLNHFIKYASGSVVYDNYIFSDGIREGVDIFTKLCTFLFAFPNMFLNKAFGITLFPHESQIMRPVSEGGEASNVVDAIGYLYPSHGSPIDLTSFVIVFILLGLIVGCVGNILALKNGRALNTCYTFFLTYFLFMSFFGTFYVGSGVWELMIWCLLLPPFFRNRVNILCKVKEGAS